MLGSFFFLHVLNNIGYIQKMNKIQEEQNGMLKCVIGDTIQPDVRQLLQCIFLLIMQLA